MYKLINVLQHGNIEGSGIYTWTTGVKFIGFFKVKPFIMSKRQHKTKVGIYKRKVFEKKLASRKKRKESTLATKKKKENNQDKK